MATEPKTKEPSALAKAMEEAAENAIPLVEIPEDPGEDE